MKIYYLIELLHSGLLPPIEKPRDLDIIEKRQRPKDTKARGL